MEFKIVPYKSVGLIQLGMTVEEVRKILGGEVKSFIKTPTSEMPTDAFRSLGLHAHYKKPGICQAIELFEPAEPTFRNQVLLGLPFEDLEKWFKEIDNNAKSYRTGLISYTFGISLYAPYASKFPEEIVEGVIVFEKGYYDGIHF